MLCWLELNRRCPLRSPENHLDLVVNVEQHLSLRLLANAGRHRAAHINEELCAVGKGVAVSQMLEVQSPRADLSVIEQSTSTQQRQFVKLCERYGTGLMNSAQNCVASLHITYISKVHFKP
jgi:hypothetical protein